ncbi:hypothetical protein Mapa_010140 [Marchantia paleacea]|nr:hypothetical protein Mapa_010140 [Marchantia paleacea]
MLALQPPLHPALAARVLLLMLLVSPPLPIMPRLHNQILCLPFRGFPSRSRRPRRSVDSPPLRLQFGATPRRGALVVLHEGAGREPRIARSLGFDGRLRGSRLLRQAYPGVRRGRSGRALVQLMSDPPSPLGFRFNACPLAWSPPPRPRPSSSVCKLRSSPPTSNCALSVPLLSSPLLALALALWTPSTDPCDRQLRSNNDNNDRSTASEPRSLGPTTRKSFDTRREREREREEKWDKASVNYTKSVSVTPVLLSAPHRTSPTVPDCHHHLLLLFCCSAPLPSSRLVCCPSSPSFFSCRTLPSGLGSSFSCAS